MLHLRGERLAYGDHVVLPDVDFRLRPAERVVLLGRSGSGKSTLLNTIHARLVAQGRRDLALVPQEHGLVPQLSVFHNVYMGRLNRHRAAYNLVNLVWPLTSQRRQVEKALVAVGLEGLGRKPVGALSGGQKQRTALARAIHHGGTVLIGDEPVSAVDERHAAELIARLGQRFETLVLALHDVALARLIATRIVGIKGGRLMIDRPVQQVSDGEIDALYRL